MLHERATLVHPIASSKPAASATGIRLTVPLEVPRHLQGPPYLASVATSGATKPSTTINCWRFLVDLGYVCESATVRIELS